MPTTETLAAATQLSVSRWMCRGESSGWADAEPASSHRVALVRSGVFRRRSLAGWTELDPTLGYVGLPHEEEQFAHPCGGDVCTAVSVAPDLWFGLAGEASPARPIVYVDARLDLVHRQVLAAAGRGDHGYALVERSLAMIAEVVRQVAAGPVPAADRPRPDDRRLVAEARAAIRDDVPPARGLVPLADQLGASPYRLSRAFSREIGVSLTRYRNRVRVGRALDRLEQGHVALADLAIELGFADQAHLTRTVREHVGRPPGALRRLLEHSAAD